MLKKSHGDLFPGINFLIDFGEIFDKLVLYTIMNTIF